MDQSARTMVCLGLLQAMCAGCAADPNPNLLRGVIGAAGGSLAGAPGAPLEGVVLDIEPGALVSDIEITISRSFDDTPLPLGADHCGWMFAIEPNQLALAAPAHLTLPVSLDLPRSRGHAADDVQVWGREGEGWTRFDPLSASAGSIQVAIQALSTFGPGVRIYTSPLVCGFGGCALPPEFSVSSAGVVPFQNHNHALAADAAAVYYGSTDALGRGMGIRYNLTTRVTKTSLLKDAGWVILNATNIGVDGKGNFWSPTELGNVMFPFTGASPIEYSEHGLGVVVTTSGTLVRLNSASFSVLTPGGFFDSSFNPDTCTTDACRFRAQFPQPLQGEVGTDARGDPSRPDSFWVAIEQVGDLRVRRYSVTTHTHDLEIAIPYLLGTQHFSVAPDGTIAHIDDSLDAFSKDPPPHRTVWRISQARGVQGREVPTVMGSPLYDATGALWMMSAATPQLFVLKPDDSLVTIPLTTATDPASADYLGHVPLAIQVRPDGSFAVMTYAREILLIRRN